LPLTSLISARIPPVTQGIKFCDRLFTEPTRLSSALIPPVSGIYAILVPDAGCSPRQFRPVYFGESSNLNGRVSTSHEKYNDWVRAAAGSQLYLAHHATILMNDQQRRDAECELINHYRPECNDRINTPPLLKSLYGV
jgi:hypothetical protein